MLDTQEAYNLWDMLRTRYDGVEQIQFFQNYIHDIDFGILAKATLGTVFEDQINELEKEMYTYGIGLPRRPPKSVRTPANTEAVEDRFMNSTNDRLRNIYSRFLWKEVDLLNTWIKYGNAKGWLRPTPRYKTTTS